jgi:hypothetical protein
MPFLGNSADSADTKMNSAIDFELTSTNLANTGTELIDFAASLPLDNATALRVHGASPETVELLNRGR